MHCGERLGAQLPAPAPQLQHILFCSICYLAHVPHNWLFIKRKSSHSVPTEQPQQLQVSAPVLFLTEEMSLFGSESMRRFLKSVSALVLWYARGQYQSNCRLHFGCGGFKPLP